MAIPHARPGGIINVKPLGASLREAKTSTLFKTERAEAIRIVMRQGKEISEHKAPGEIIVQCLEGRIAFTAMGATRELNAGDMIYLETEEPHAVRCIEDASFLVTILSN